MHHAWLPEARAGLDGLAGGGQGRQAGQLLRCSFQQCCSYSRRCHLERHISPLLGKSLLAKWHALLPQLDNR